MLPRRIWAYGQVFKDVLRRQRGIHETDAKHVLDTILPITGVGSVAGLAYLIQGIIPGVQNLYPWAFPLIMSIFVFAILAMHIASDYRLQLERPKLFDVDAGTGRRRR